MYEEILYELDDPTAVISLNRPDQLNAWTPQMARELRHAFAEAEKDERVVGIILTGAGRGFCAGADMGRLQSISQGDRQSPSGSTTADPGDETMDAGFRQVTTYAASLRKPVIAAVNGPCAGIAVPIACFCDMRFASEKASFHTAFSRRGLIAEWGLSWILPRLVGVAHAMDLILSARKVVAAEAERIGLVNRVVPADELIDHAKDYVRELAKSCAPLSLSIMKRQVYEHLLVDLKTALDDSEQLMKESLVRDEFKEGVSSFVEKRPPEFPRVSV